MKKATLFLAMLAALFVSGCGGSSGGNSTPPDTSDPASMAPLATPKGEPVGTAVTATIGVAGGSLTSIDGKLTINIPAGALTADTVISIQPITNHAPGAKGGGYRLLPDGQTFQTPVSLVFSYTEDELGSGGADVLDMAFQTADSYWQLADTIAVDKVNKTVTATTTHFCDWAAGIERFRLVPLSSTVGVNGSLTLVVQECWTIRGARNEVTMLSPILGHELVTYDSHKASWWITDWAVNAIHGGNSTVGTVSYGTYTAPASKPNPDTVTVSVHLNRDHIIYQLTATVKIDDAPSYFGEMRFTAKNKAANGDTWTASGWLDITLRRTYDSDVASQYTLSTPTRIVFTSYETVQGLMTCTLTKQLSQLEPAMSGEMLLLQKNSHWYTFNGVLFANGRMRCVDNSFDPPHITEKTGPINIPILTNRGTADLGQKPFTDANILADSSTYSDAETKIDLTWGLKRTNSP